MSTINVFQKRKNLIVETIITFIFSCLILLSFYLDFNYHFEILKIITSIIIPLGWFIIYPFFLNRYFLITNKNPPKLIRLWIKLVVHILPHQITAILATIFAMIIFASTSGMVINLREKFDPKMISNYIGLLIYIITICFMFISDYYCRTEKDPPKAIKICRQLIRQHAFTTSIVVLIAIPLASSLFLLITI